MKRKKQLHPNAFMPGLNAKQARMMNFIADYIEVNEEAPTIEEMRVGLEYKSKSPVHHHLKSLEKEGYILRNKYIARSIEILIDTF